MNISNNSGLLATLLLLFMTVQASAEETRFEYRAELSNGDIVFVPTSEAAIRLRENENEIFEMAGQDVATIAREKDIQLDPLTAEILTIGATSQPIDFQTINYNEKTSSDELLAEWTNKAQIYKNQTPYGANIIAISDLGKDTIAGLSVKRMEEISQQVAEELFIKASAASCGAAIRPDKIIPEVSVSFSLFAGAEFSLAAEFEMNRLCTELKALKN